MPSKATSIKPWFTDQSLSTSFTSDSYPVDYQALIGITMDVVGLTTNSGQFYVQASNDNISWYTLNVSPNITLTNINDSFDIHLHGLPYRFIRMTFTPAGPTPDGSVSAIISAKAVC
jgi:hypothetical protein